jgi:hypothetical protein
MFSYSIITIGIFLLTCSFAAAQNFFPNKDNMNICNNSNFVLVGQKAERRPFSLQVENFILPSDRPHCLSSREIISAIKYGERRWKYNVPMNMVEKEILPSSFSPSKCKIPTLSPQNICRIMSKFSQIVLLGDSLMRHVYEGMLIGLTDDVVDYLVPVTNHSYNDLCKCDGMFSESAACRTKYMRESSVYPQRQGICRSINNKSGDSPVRSCQLAWKFGYEHCDKFMKEMKCSSADKRPMLLIIQGGFHFKANANVTFGHFLPLWNHPMIKECARNRNLLVIWQGFEAVSPLNSAKYPHQGPKFAMPFNYAMETEFALAGMQNISFMDVFNLTLGAQTSDGLHKLLDVNYFKAQYTLAVAEFMLAEEKYFYYPPLHESHVPTTR